ncbi:hypothetical protein TNCV_3675291 [Trichonephila clavipes]|nr:hypothetical protein TNCV_3675291 [Trichonephila clavipes]
MKTSSVEFISRSPTPSPMNSNYRRFSFGLYGTYRCGQRTVRRWPAVAAKAKTTAVFARRRTIPVVVSFFFIVILLTMSESSSEGSEECRLTRKRKRGVRRTEEYKRNRIKKARLSGTSHENWNGNIVPAKHSVESIEYRCCS